MQTRENRIYRHYLGMKRGFDPRRESFGPNVWMPLARHWQIPIKEIKRIVAEEKARLQNEREATNTR